MGRATFSTESGNSNSRSHSRQRPPRDLEAGLFRSIDETAIDSTDETAPLLADTPTRRPSRIGSVYGSSHHSNSFSAPHFINIDGHESELTSTPGTPSGSHSHTFENGIVALGAKDKKSESILKLSGLIDDRGGEFERFRMSEEDMTGMSKAVVEFYRNQNSILDGFLEVDEILDNTRAMATTGDVAPEVPTKPSAGKEAEFNQKVKVAINVNFIINFLLLGGKIAVVLLSNSMSLIASTVDSAMDFLSTVIIFGTNRVIEHKSWKSDYHYPVGKRRMEPTGVLVFSVFMIASFLQVFIESVHRLLDPNLEMAYIPTSGIIVMVLTIIIKLAVWFWCRAIKNTSVEALAQDAENDIVFNFFSLVFPYVGQKLGWKYLDPLGGALLSVYIIVEWTQTLFENAQKLTGKRAGPEAHQRVAYLLTRFSPLIKGIQHLSVYASGDHFIVETDVVLPATTGLTRAHNCAESAQYGLEQLEGVERAYIHVDVTSNNLSGHLPR